MEEKGKKTTAFSRRDFIKAVLASSALYAVGGGSRSWAAVAKGLGPIPPGNGPFDVAIIGAGTAGLSAAQALLAAGRTNIVVLEARDRLGGRTHSVNDFMKYPVDLGAEWFHFITPNITGGPGTNNPVFDLAFNDGQGVKPLGLFPDFALRAFYQGSQPASIEDSIVPAAIIVGVEEFIRERGELTAQHPGQHLDVPASQAAQRFAGQPWFDLAVGLETAQHGPTLEDLGCLDLSNLLRLGLAASGPNDENWLIRSGLGNFVATLANGVPLSLNTPVTAVTWGGNKGIQLATPAGTVQAQAVIVTIPTGVLAAGTPTFNPLLPSDYIDAIQGLPMNHIEKVFLRFKRNIFKGVPPHTMITQLADTRSVPVVRARVWGKNVAMIFLGSNEDPTTHPTTAELAQQGPQALIDFGLSVVAQAFPEATAQFVEGITSDWITGPYSQGAYSYAPAGNVPLRQFLSTPLHKQIFFAGEAVALLSHSSVPGAYKSGQTAAQKVLKALK
jgi:monoamine oxidase